MLRLCHFPLRFAVAMGESVQGQLDSFTFDLMVQNRRPGADADPWLEQLYELGLDRFVGLVERVRREQAGSRSEHAVSDQLTTTQEDAERHAAQVVVFKDLLQLDEVAREVAEYNQLSMRFVNAAVSGLQGCAEYKQHVQVIKNGMGKRLTEMTDRVQREEYQAQMEHRRFPSTDVRQGDPLPVTPSPGGINQRKDEVHDAGKRLSGAAHELRNAQDMMAALVRQEEKASERHCGMLKTIISSYLLFINKAKMAKRDEATKVCVDLARALCNMDHSAEEDVFPDAGLAVSAARDIMSHQLLREAQEDAINTMSEATLNCRTSHPANSPVSMCREGIHQGMIRTRESDRLTATDESDTTEAAQPTKKPITENLL